MGVERVRPLRMRDVAERAGVSTQTVSNFVNGRYARLSRPTRERVRSAIEELGYEAAAPSRGRRLQRARALGFLVVDRSERFLADPLTSLYLAGLADATRACGYGVLVHAAETGTDLLRPLREGHLDGVCLLLSGRRAERLRIADAVAAVRSPFVLLDEVLPRSRHHYPAVTADQRQGARRLVLHLAERGHRRLAFLAAASEWAVLEERYAGYRGALDELGIRPDSRLTRFEGDWRPGTTASMVDAVLAVPDPPTALICGSDLVAAAAIRHLRDLGRDVPRDVAVTGFDDFDFSPHLQPALTTVAVPAWEMGRAAGQLLLDALAGRRSARHQMQLPVTLRVRAST